MSETITGAAAPTSSPQVIDDTQAVACADNKQAAAFASVLAGALFAVVATLAASLAPVALAAEKPLIPILAPITGFLSLEGTAQRNGAVLAVKQAPAGLAVDYRVLDTATSPRAAVQAFEKAMRGDRVVAVSAPIFGTQMLALLPLAKERGVPLLTISGTAKITEMGNPYVFRFFPGDAVVKTAQARYVVEELNRKRAALITQTTAYGQSGRTHLMRNLQKLGAEVVLDEALQPTVKDMLPVLIKARRSGADVLVLQLHSTPTALLVKQAAAMGLGLPIVAGSAMHQPSTAALLTPAELAGVCAESGSSPISGGSKEMEAFTRDFRAAFKTEPDAFAAGQYDAVMMVLKILSDGATTAAQVRDRLAADSYRGIATTYRSDGKGNMARDAVIVCYDGTSRAPKIVRRYRNVNGSSGG